MGSVQCVVFDLDDTLYLERDFAFSGFDAIARQFADEINAPFDVAARCRELFDSPHRARVFNQLLVEANTPHADTLVPRMIEAFRTHQPRISLCPDASAAITRLKSRFKFGLITDGFLIAQHSKVTALGLTARFHSIVLTDQWGREFWKPHPRAFETVASQLHVDHAACAYVGDNPTKDFIAPNALGWTTVMICRDGAIHHSDQNTIANLPPENRPHDQINSLDDLERVLE